MFEYRVIIGDVFYTFECEFEEDAIECAREAWHNEFHEDLDDYLADEGIELKVKCKRTCLV